MFIGGIIYQKSKSSPQYAYNRKYKDYVYRKMLVQEYLEK